MFTIPFSFLQYTNYLILIWFLITLYRGYKRGLILQVVDLVTTLVSLLTAWVLSPVFQNIYQFVETSSNGYVSITQLIGQQTNRLIWFVILFVVIRLMLLLIKPIASFISKMPLISQVNSSIGGVFSIVMFAINMVILIALLGTPVIANGHEVIENSILKNVKQVSDPIVNVVFTEVGKNEALQTIIMEQRLTDEQAADLTNWLASKGFTNNEIKEFLSKYE